MYVKNTNFAIYLGLAALVGFGASFLFSSSNSESSLLSGDISKASRYNNVKEDPAVTVMEEKLQNDENFYNLTKNAYTIIESRVDGLEDLTSRTIEICSNIPEFKTAIKNVVSLNAKAYNTKQSLMVATNGLQKLSEGKSAPEYEQASSNVFVGFQKIEYQLAIGKAFVEEAASYLDGKEGAECDAIAGLVAEWSVYCAQDAVLNNSDKEIAYWNDKSKEMVAGSASIALALGDIVRDLGFGDSVKDLGFGDSVKDLGLGDSVKDLGLGDSVKDLGFGDSVKDLGLGDIVRDLGFGDSVKDLGFGDGVRDLGFGDMVRDLGFGDGVRDLGFGDGVRDLGLADGVRGF